MNSKRFIFSLLAFLFSVIYLQAQNRLTPYDNLPGINKIEKPTFVKQNSGWESMLYQYPVNFYEIENRFNAWEKTATIKKTPASRYYKMWRKAVLPYVKSDGTIVLPDKNKIFNNLLERQQNTRKMQKSTTLLQPEWRFIGPKETFWKNEEDFPNDRYDNNGDPAQCPWQANVYSFDIAHTNSNILYCGTETGFINKTTDNGQNWHFVGKDYPFGGGILSLAIHPENEQIIYASAGNQIHKSTNGGDSWLPLLDANNNFSANHIKISRLNNKTVIASADNGLYISRNDGIDWEKKWSAPVYDVEFNVENDSIIYALTKNISGMYRLIVSNDFGDTFKKDPDFSEIYTESSGGLLAVTHANSNTIYCTMLANDNGEGVPFILKGTANGESFSWQLTKKGEPNSIGGLGGFTVGQGYFDLVLEVSPNDENIVFWGTCVLWKSIDGAQNFSKVGGYGGDFPIHPDIQDMRILPDGKIWVATDGGMNYSTDYFSEITNYSSRTKGIMGSDMWGFDQGWNEDLIVGGRYHNGNTAIADFYGQKSLRMGGAESPTGWVIQGKSRHVAFNDLGNGWILPKNATEVEEGRFIFSKFPNMDEYGARRSNLLHHPNYYGTMFLAEGNGFWKTTDTGETFDLLYQFPNRVRYLQMAYSNPDVIYADVVGKGLYRSDDGGITWVHKPSLTNGSYGTHEWNGKLFFAISPFDENKIYACLSNGAWSADKGKIFKSDNGGDTWEDWTVGLDEYTKCIVVQPASNGKDLVYLFTTNKKGKQARVYYRSEGQPYWNEFGYGYPAGMSVNIALPFYRDAKIRVAGNAGVWEATMADTAFLPLVNPWVEKKHFDCAEDTIIFDDHSILNHSGASWLWEISPQPTYLSDANARNPKVVLGEPGDYSVSLTIEQNGKSFTKNIEKMISASECPSVLNCNNPGQLDKTLWKLIGADSEEINGEDGKATNAFDNDISTIWHTEWYLNEPGQPHEIKIELDREYLLSSFTYLPRQDSPNGRIKKYEFFVSNSKIGWGYPVASGEFDNDAIEKKISFEPKSGKYIKLRSLSEINGNSFTSVAEIDVNGCIQNNSSGLNEIAINEIKAYPVPASNYIMIDLPLSGKNAVWKYSLYSLTGAMVKNGVFKTTGSDYKFSVESLHPGSYFIILNNNNRTFRIKMIVSRK
ncbi:MAG: hypothetical protein CR996_01525 [Draconibacterium sp.]|nr:MAG: hypothetical protein CR996_01525 [Draconibacterium sp.]